MRAPSVGPYTGASGADSVVPPYSRVLNTLALICPSFKVSFLYIHRAFHARGAFSAHAVATRGVFEGARHMPYTYQAFFLAVQIAWVTIPLDQSEIFMATIVRAVQVLVSSGDSLRENWVYCISLPTPGEKKNCVIFICSPIDFLLFDWLHWPWQTDRSLHYTPIHIQHSLAAWGCNTHAAAEYTNLHLGGVST